MIKPALSVESWASLRAYQNHAQLAVLALEGGHDHGVPPLALDGSNEAERNSIAYAAAIAALNAGLPDSDPRKITREKITAIRTSADAFYVDNDGLRDADRDDVIASLAVQAADALESYLPPEPT
jgi:hypothetical protein